MAEEKVTPETENATPDVETLAAEIATLKAENAKLKESVTAASSQAADFKRKWRDTMSEQERKDAEIAEQRAKETAELVALRAEKRVGGYTKKFVAAGYDPATAEIMAAALPEGVDDSYFEAAKSGMDARIEAAKASLLNSQPTVTGGQSFGSKTTQEINKEKLRKAFGL